MARVVTLAGYQQGASAAAAETVTLFEGGRRLGAKARAEGQPREGNPFTEGSKGTRRQGGDRYRAAGDGLERRMGGGRMTEAGVDGARRGVGPPREAV